MGLFSVCALDKAFFSILSHWISFATAYPPLTKKQLIYNMPFSPSQLNSEIIAII